MTFVDSPLHLELLRMGNERDKEIKFKPLIVRRVAAVARQAPGVDVDGHGVRY